MLQFRCLEEGKAAMLKQVAADANDYAVHGFGSMEV